MKGASNVSSIVPPVKDLEKLVNNYLICKGELLVAQSELAAAESDLLAAVGYHEEGSFTVRVADTYAVTTTGKINRSVDAQKWEQIRAKIPAPLANRLVRLKPEVNIKELRYIQLNEPAYWDLVSQAITSKPAKPSVAVKPINQE